MTDTPETTGGSGTDTVTVQYGSAPGRFSWPDLWKALKVILYGAVSVGLVAFAHGVAGADFSMFDVSWHGITVTGPQIATVVTNVLLYVASLIARDTRKA